MESGDTKGKLTPDATLENPTFLTFAWKWEAAKGDFKINFTKPGSKFDKDMRVQGVGDDTLYGGASDDWIAGQAGDDIIYGGDDNDTLYGDDAVALPKGFVDGNDTLYAGKGKDKLYGNGGNDRLIADDDDHDQDELYGGDGMDELHGGTGHDKLNRGKGNDKLYAGSDGSEMDGGEDNDTYISGAGDDHMTDASGDDTYQLSSGTDTIVDKGGDDTYQTGSGHMVSAGTTTIQDHDGKGKIVFNGSQLTNDSILATAENEWRTIDGRVALTKSGNNLVMRSTIPNSQGRVIFTGFFSKDEFLSLKLSAYNKPQPPQTNNPPQVGKAIPSQAVNEKSQLQFTLPADAFNDPDNDALKYTATLADGRALPKWLHFDAAKRTFTGTPGNDDVGNLSIRVTANDGRGGSATQNFALEVVNVNDAPQIGAILANQQGTGGKPWQYRLPTNAFHDIDKGDTLTLSAKLDNGQPLPSWLTFDAATGQFSGTPPSSKHASTYRITVTATDKAGAQARQAFNLHIAAAATEETRNEIRGTAGNDTLYGTAGNDIIDGGAGNDSLDGGAGSDIYRFSGNFGQNTIHNNDSSAGRLDTLLFTDLKREDVSITRNGDDLVIKDRHSDNQVTVQYHFYKNDGDTYRIDKIRFADGSSLDYDAINRLVQQPAGNPPRANLVQDRYAADAARQAQVMTQAMAASGSGQPLDNLMAPYNPPLVPPLFSNFNP